MITPGRPVKDVDITNNSDDEIFKELTGRLRQEMLRGDIPHNMISDKKCTKFLSFIGAIVSTGFRGIIRDMIKKNGVMW